MLAQNLKHTTGEHHFVNIANKKQFFNISNQIVMVSDRPKPNLAETEMNLNLGYLFLQPKPKPKFRSKSCRNLNLNTVFRFVMIRINNFSLNMDMKIHIFTQFLFVRNSVISSLVSIDSRSRT